MLDNSQAFMSSEYSTFYGGDDDCDSNGLWASSECSGESSSPDIQPLPLPPPPPATVYWVTPSPVVKQEVTTPEVKQEKTSSSTTSTPDDGILFKTERLSDSEIVADDEWNNQTSMEPFFDPVQMEGQLFVPPLAPTTTANSLPPQQQQNVFAEGSCGNDGGQQQSSIPKELTFVPPEKKIKLETVVVSKPRQKGYRQAKLAASIAGTPPLPPDLELPAILGGKLPPRDIKSGTKRKHVFTEKELRRRRKRGLPDDSDSESEERRLVRLPRRSLLTITTPQMSHFVTFMRSTVNLTPSQEDELSRQKRLVKNRECACRFRAKKELTLIEYRERLNELEDDVITLRAENDQLRQALKQAEAKLQAQN